MIAYTIPDISKILNENELDFKKFVSENFKALANIVAIEYPKGTKNQASISLLNDANDGKYNYLEFLPKARSDVSSLDNVLYVDNGGQLVYKHNTTSTIISKINSFSLIPIVTLLPDPKLIPDGYADIVIFNNEVNVYVNGAWKILAFKP